jgi:aspartate-semialdehyde dehydrogenase
MAIISPFSSAQRVNVDGLVASSLMPTAPYRRCDGVAPLHAKFGVRKVFVVDDAGRLGAGYPGVPSLDILGNVIPYIGDEEPRSRASSPSCLEVRRHEYRSGRHRHQCARQSRSRRTRTHRVHVSVLRPQANARGGVRCLREWTGNSSCEDCRVRAVATLIVKDELDRPQPRRDAPSGRGMAVTIGRVRADR